MYYQGQEIKTLYHQGRQITLLYYQGMVVYRIGGPEGETYAIINTLDEAKSILPDTHFDWVWVNDRSKWYRYNNIRQYEEYGIYADTIESYVETWIEEDVPEELYQTPFQPTINTVAHIEGTLKSVSDALYYGYTNSDDSKDYRFFKASRDVYWDMNSTRQNLFVYKITVGDYISVNVGNNYTQGWYGSYALSLIDGTLRKIADPHNLNINLSAIDIDYFAIYEDSELVYEILKREDGTHYSRQREIVGTTTYKGKLAIVDGIEYQFDGNDWVVVGSLVKDFDIDLNGQWQLSPTSPSVDGSDIYESFSNYHISKGVSTAYLVATKDGDLNFYARSNGEAGYDYLTITYPDGTSVNTKNKASVNFTEYSHYMNVGERIQLTYSKNGIVDKEEDSAFVWFPVFKDVFYEEIEPISYREYMSYADFDSDSEKYGNCAVYIIDTDDLLLYTYNNQEIGIDNSQIIEYKGTDKVIPKVMSNFFASSYNPDTGMGKMVFADTLTAFPAGFFSGNTALTEYTLPSTVTTLGNNVFNGCSNLTTFDIGNCKLSDGAFKGTKISNITLGSKVISIPASCFEGCKNLQKVTIGYPMPISIEASSFAGSVITEISANKMQTIGNCAFKGATLPETLYLSRAGGKLGTQCFSGVKGLKTLTFGNGITNVSNNPFEYSSIENLIFDDASTITSFGEISLYQANSLKTLRVPNIAISFHIYANLGGVLFTTPPMDRDALIQVFNDLATVTDKTLTIGETLLAKLTDEDIAIATNKGWTLA